MPRRRGSRERWADAQIRPERLGNSARPERGTSTTNSAGIALCPVTFVALSPGQERRAVEALAELLVPLLGVKHGSRTGPIAVPAGAGSALANGQQRPGSRPTTASEDDASFDDHDAPVGHDGELGPARSGSESEQGPALLRE
jgi:hypothetical protein